MDPIEKDSVFTPGNRTQTFEQMTMLDNFKNLEALVESDLTPTRVVEYKFDPTETPDIISEKILQKDFEDIGFQKFDSTGKSFGWTNLSLILYKTENGFFHFYITNKVKRGNEKTELPGFGATSYRPFFGVAWKRLNDAQIDLRLRENMGRGIGEFCGSEVMGQNQRIRDINAMYAMFTPSSRERYCKDIILLDH